MGDFQLDTEIESIGEGRYRAQLDRDWEIWGPNGGYLAAIALRAAGAEARIARPVALGCHFLSVASFAELEIEVAVLRSGRRAESLRVSLVQKGRPVIEAWVRTASPCDGLAHDYAEAPKVPAPDTLPDIEDLMEPDAQRHAFWKNLCTRPIDPSRTQDWSLRPAAPPVFNEWFRFRPRATFEDPWLDAGRLALIIDSLTWAAACQPHPGHGYIAPNLDLAVWFHASDPTSEWLLADSAAPLAAGGLIGTNSRVWSERGQLLASGGAQLLCAPAPDQ